MSLEEADAEEDTGVPESEDDIEIDETSEDDDDDRDDEDSTIIADEEEGDGDVADIIGNVSGDEETRVISIGRKAHPRSRATRAPNHWAYES